MGSSPGPGTIEARVAGLPAVVFSALAVELGSGTIIFTRGDGPPGSLLMTMRPDGTDVQVLPGSVPGDFDPDRSPDGSRFVFANFAANSSRISGFNSFADIVVMNADGTGRVRLTDHFGSVSGPVWSPDGSKIAFASDQTGQSEVYVMDADGSDIVRLTSTGGSAPSWSPDGSRIAVGREESPVPGAPLAFVMDATDGGNVVPLAPGADPAFSPDGSVIALVFCPQFSNCDPDDPVLALIQPDGSGLTPLSPLPGVYQPAWSPDGSKIVARILNQAHPGTPPMSRLFTVNADGTGFIVLSAPADHLPTWEP
jgi:TolB protein